MSKPSKKKPSKKIHSDETKIGKKLTLRQDIFCQLYVKNKELFGNGTMCYAQAYNFRLEELSTEAVYEEEYDDDKDQIRTKKIDNSPYDKARLTCQVNSSRMLSNAIINQRINDLLITLMDNDAVDAELAWIMNQRQELAPKVQAIREFNKLKKRVTEKRELEIKGLNLKSLYELANDDE